MIHELYLVFVLSMAIPLIVGFSIDWTMQLVSFLRGASACYGKKNTGSANGTCRT